MVRTFPKALSWIGLVVVVLSLILAARLVWEQTVWTWNQGPQMVGFSLMHTGLGLPLLLALWGGLLWVAAVVIFAVLSRSIGGARMMVALIITYGLAWAIVATPYGFWQRLFVEKLARTPRAADFVQYAAALGDLKTVEAFFSKGVAVDARNRSGATPLHAAAVEGQLVIAEYLLAKGADVNAINRYGDSPLENAVSMNRTEMARLLTERGGKRIRGSEDQRNNASKAIVLEQMEEMDRRALK